MSILNVFASTNGNRSLIYLRLAALLTVLAAAAVLVVGADSSPTTSNTRQLFGLWRMRYVVLALALLVIAIGLFLASRSRDQALGFCMSLMSVFLTVGILEGVGAVGILSWPALLSQTNGDLGGLGTKPVPNLDIRGMTRQDIAAAWKLPNDELPFHYKTDSNGFRNSIDRQTADVILLGDSILLSALVPAEKTVSAVLEKTITRSVMQVALIGLSPQEEHKLFRDSKIDVQDRLILQFIFEGNDLLDSKRYRQQQEQAQATTTKTKDRGLLIDQIWKILTSITDPGAQPDNRDVCKIGSQSYAFLWTRRSFAGHGDEAPHITRAIEEFAAEIERKGGRYAVVFVPTKLRILAPLCTFSPGSKLRDYNKHLTPLRAELHDWSKKSGIELLDLTQGLKSSANTGQIPWFWGDTHWNEFGHAAAANQIRNWEVLGRETEQRP